MIYIFLAVSLLPLLTGGKETGKHSCITGSDGQISATTKNCTTGNKIKQEIQKFVNIDG